jgi:hypothetical protein
MVRFVHHPSEQTHNSLRFEATVNNATSSSSTDQNSQSQSPPFHLHFNQLESFSVLSGEIGTTLDYSCIDTIHTPQSNPPDKPHHIDKWMPHRFWPSPTAKEDSVLLVWAHPSDVDEKMDRLFFQNLLMYISDVSENKRGMDVLQLCLMQ